MGRRHPAPTARVGRDSGLPEHPQFLPAPSQGSPGRGTCGCRAGGAAPAADPRGHGAGRGANRRRVRLHCPRPRHSPPIHLPARQIPAPGHDNICLLLRVQLTCCRLLLRHRPFPPTATVTATAATVTAVTATAAATAAPHGVTPRPFSVADPEPVALSRWKIHSGNTGICPGTCRAASRKRQEIHGAGRAGSQCCVPLPIWVHDAPSVPPVWRGTARPFLVPVWDAGMAEGGTGVCPCSSGSRQSCGCRDGHPTLRRAWDHPVAPGGCGAPGCAVPPVPRGVPRCRCGSCSPLCRRDLQAQAPVMSFAPDRWRQGAREAASAPPAPVPGP